MENPCNSLDKRTNAYKECVKSKEYKNFKGNFEEDNTIGAGDVIEKVTKATGIKKAVKWLAGEDCGCDGRKEKANKLRIKIARCPTQQEYQDIKDLLDTKPTRLTHEQQKLVIKTHNNVFGTRLKIGSKCGSCYAGFLNKLNQMIELYG